MIAHVCVALCLAAGAPAAASSRTIEATPLGFAYDASGRAVAAWQGITGPDANHTRAFAAFAIARRDGTWRAPRALRPSVTTERLAVSGTTAALATSRENPLRGNRTRSVIALTLLRTTSGAVRRSVTLASGPPRKVTYEGPQPSLLSPAVAAAPDGSFVVAWTRGFPAADVWAANVDASGHATRARRLGPGGGAVLAIGADGRGVIAWQRGRRVLARVRRSNGRWSAIEPAFTRNRFTVIESLTAAASGRRVALGVLETFRGSGVYLHSSIAVRDAAGWHGSSLAAFTFTPTAQTSFVTGQPRVLVVAASDGALHAVWPALAGGHVQAAEAPVSAGVGTAVALSPAGEDVALEDAAAGPDQSIAAAWFDLSDGQGTPGLATVDAAGAVNTMDRLATERAVLGARIAYNPLTGRPALLWSQGSAASGYRIVSWAP